MKKIKVLVVDDSALLRQVLSTIINDDPGMEVISTASDPYAAASKIANEVPDVITLDVEMPKMDGLTFLKKIMSQKPIPVVICSSLTERGSDTAMRALEYGAVDIITKPKLGQKQYFEESKVNICDIIKAAAAAKVHKLKPKSEVQVTPKLSADVILQKTQNTSMIKTTETVVAVGASTGGTEALRVFLEKFPMDSPGILIVQHMPENFTKAFAKRLDSTCKISVKEAEDGDTVLRGRALIAPGNMHMLLKRSGAKYFVELKGGPLVSRHRPSVDVLFRSTARYAGRNAIGVIMTGMGDDGAKGMLEMKEVGAYTIAQNEETCVVYGMPNEAVKLGGVESVMPLNLISETVLNHCVLV
ncbi:MAG: chemotaxis response regulator protein-glutamate methylesterase [Rhodothermaceae bacterium]